MIKKIAFAAVLFQVAAFSALITQTLLFSSGATQAAANQPVGSAEAASGMCATATWPDIPAGCLERVEPRKISFVIKAGE